MQSVIESYVGTQIENTEGEGRKQIKKRKKNIDNQNVILCPWKFHLRKKEEKKNHPQSWIYIVLYR